MSFWKSWRYKNLTIFFLSIFFAIFLSGFEIFQNFLLSLGNLGYFGAFLAGALFVSTFTVATGVLMLFTLAEKLSPLEIGLIAGLGAVFCDFIIFRFVKDDLVKEIHLIYNHIDKDDHLLKLLYSKYFSWTLPVIGAIIIASPFPDEIGVSLMGISKMKTYEFLIMSFVFNAIGIFLVVSASSLVK